MALRGPKFTAIGLRYVEIGKFPNNDLVMVYERRLFCGSRIGVFERPTSGERAAKAKALSVVAAIQAETSGFKPCLSGLTV
jgi:hypothetical protein